MRFAILGAGAIGAYLGAALARGGADVVLIARGAHLEAMQRGGVRVESPRGDFHVHPETTDELAAIATAGVVFIGVKAYSLPALAPRIAEHLKPQTALIAGQNGVPWWYFESHGGRLDGLTLESVDPGGVVSRSFGRGRSIGCVAYAATEIVAPGVIRHVEGTRFTLGEPDRSVSDRCRAISEALVAGGLKAPVDEDVRSQIWLKLLGNASFNPLSALTGATMGQFGEVEAAELLLRSMMDEIAAVGTALGIEVPVTIDRRLERGIAVGAHKTSMLQDLEAGKPLEHECMTGAVVELGGHLGIEVPHVAAVHACVAMLEYARSSASG